ncbi:S1 family peptidase [Marinicella sp. W31]|uniref:S1 family peptidase n=1 Tax=Marinicella sp. W31 TaxID=3023713 RepID=UPI003756E08C
MNCIDSKITVLLIILILIAAEAISDETGTSSQPILGGELVPEGELEAIGRIPGCSATLIEPDLVLTAAHCVCTGETSRTDCSTNSRFTLVNVRPIDDLTTSVDESLTRQNIGLDGVINVHPQYTSAGWLSHDFATIRLERKVSEVAFDVNPIPLELPSQRPILQDPLTIVGFGIAPPCTSADSGKRRVTLSVNEITTGNVTLRVGSDNAQACPGDSGGPALNASGHVVGVASSLPANYDPIDLAYSWIYPDTSVVKPNGVHGLHLGTTENRHLFKLVSVYPLSIGGVIKYEWDNVRDPGQSRYIRRLNVINKTNDPVSFRHKLQLLDLSNIGHAVELDEVASVSLKGKRGFHFEMQDRHQFYFPSVYPITENGRISYEWDNVRDPNTNNYIRRLNVINKSNFPVQFRIKVARLVDATPNNPALADVAVVNTAEGLIKNEVLDETKVVSANGKHGFHFERQDKHQYYLESVYPITEGGRITYEWDNVRDPGSSGFIRRLTVMNQSNIPVTFRIKVLKARINNRFKHQLKSIQD